MQPQGLGTATITAIPTKYCRHRVNIKLDSYELNNVGSVPVTWRPWCFNYSPSNYCCHSDRNMGHMHPWSITVSLKIWYSVSANSILLLCMLSFPPVNLCGASDFYTLINLISYWMETSFYPVIFHFTQACNLRKTKKSCCVQWTRQMVHVVVSENIFTYNQIFEQSLTSFSIIEISFSVR